MTSRSPARAPAPRAPLPLLVRQGRRAGESLRSSNSGLLLLAVLVGAGAGGGAVVFRWLISSFTELFTGHADYAGLGPVANPNVAALGRWFVIFAPVAAGLLYGPLVYFFAREARGHGVPEVMYAVARRGGRIAPQVAVVKALASALCIGGGGSVGREGPIVQIGSALGSTLGRVVRAPESRMRVLVACGAAGGIAATFNAPLAGVFFALELLLRDIAAQAFGMVVLASVTASVIGRAALGSATFLALPAFSVQHFQQYLLFALLGVLAGLAGAAFTRILYWIEDACDWAWRGPEWLRPAVGGILLGALLLVLPQMYGVGYPVLGNGIAGKYGIALLLVLLVAKMVATSLTIGIGGSGGVFAPSLFIGAMLGAAYGQIVGHLVPGVAGPAGAYALIGMGAVFAGAARAPITAVIIMFELTGEYSIILPLMAAIVLATGVSHLVSSDTIYTLKLRRRGVDLDAPAHADLLAAVSVAQAMGPAGRTIPADLPLPEVGMLLGNQDLARVAVLDADDRYCGTVTAASATDALSDDQHDKATAASVLEFPPPVKPADTLATALDRLDEADGPIPVVDGDQRLVGWLSHQQVLSSLRRSPSGADASAAGGSGS